MCSHLLEVDKCDVLIALTHMRVPNDRLLAQSVPELDFILGGHDHIVFLEKINEIMVLKSGTDFKQLSFTTVELLDEAERALAKDDPAANSYVVKGRFRTHTEFIEITSKFKPNEQLQAHIEKYVQSSAVEMNKVLGYTCVDLETRFKVIRTEESNFANFISDLSRVAMNTEICLLGSGSIRSDCLIPAGILQYQHIYKAFPYQEIIVVIKIKGAVLLEALENGVSKYPSFEGRFPSISGF